MLYLYVISSLLALQAVYLFKGVSLLQEISHTLKRIFAILRSVGVADSLEFFVTVDGQVKRVTLMMLKASQKLPISVAFKDKFQNDAKVDGAPQWAVDNGALGSLEVAEDGLSAVFTPAGPLGDCQVQCSADADLGEGVKSIVGSLAISILPADASEVDLIPGEAQDV